MNYVEQVRFHAAMTPERAALIVRGQHIPYAAFFRGILSSAHVLRQKGVKAGDICAVPIGGRPWALTINYALNHIGAIPVNVETDKECDAAGLKADHIITLADNKDVTSPTAIRVEPFWADGAADLSPCHEFASDDIAHIGLTSGSTGRPKAIGFPAGALQKRQALFNATTSYVGWERATSMPGLGSTLGFVFSTAVLASGRTLVVGGGKLDDTVQRLQQDKVEFIAASVAQAAELAAYQSLPGKTPLASLKGMVVGGGLMTPSLAAAIRKFLTNEALVMFGSTETGPVSFGPLKLMGTTSGWSGIILPEVKVEIVDDEGKVLEKGETGRLRISTSAEARLYSDSKKFEAGEQWHYSGDLARIGANNSLIIGGRGDWVINLGGVKLAPEVIEEDLMQVNGVADAFADGYNNRFGVQDVRVGIVVKDAERTEAILAECREVIKKRAKSSDGLALAVQSIPRNAMGKIERAKLADYFKA